MAWLEHFTEQEGRHLAHRAHQIAAPRLRDLEDQVAELAARLRNSRHDLQSTGRDFAHAASRYAGEAAHQFTDLARHEGGIAARLAAKQAIKAGRAFQADPVPVIVGAVGLALFARLFSGRRARHE